MRRQLMRQGKTPAQIAAMSFEDVAAQRQQQAQIRQQNGQQTLQKLYENTVWTDAELLNMRLTMHSSFDNLVKGQGTMNDFDGLGMAINVAAVRADDIDPSGLLSSKFTPAIDGFTRMQERHGRTGTLAFDGLGLQAAREAIDLYDQILELSTPRQMLDALHTAMQVVEKMKRSREKEVCNENKA